MSSSYRNRAGSHTTTNQSATATATATDQPVQCDANAHYWTFFPFDDVLGNSSDGRMDFALGINDCRRLQTRQAIEHSAWTVLVKHRAVPFRPLYDVLAHVADNSANSHLLETFGPRPDWPASAPYPDYEPVRPRPASVELDAQIDCFLAGLAEFSDAEDDESAPSSARDSLLGFSAVAGSDIPSAGSELPSTASDVGPDSAPCCCAFCADLDVAFEQVAATIPATAAPRINILEYPEHNTQRPTTAAVFATQATIWKHFVHYAVHQRAAPSLRTAYFQRVAAAAHALGGDPYHAAFAPADCPTYMRDSRASLLVEHHVWFQTRVAARYASEWRVHADVFGADAVACVQACVGDVPAPRREPVSTAKERAAQRSVVKRMQTCVSAHRAWTDAANAAIVSDATVSVRLAALHTAQTRLQAAVSTLPVALPLTSFPAGMLRLLNAADVCTQYMQWIASAVDMLCAHGDSEHVLVSDDPPTGTADLDGLLSKTARHAAQRQRAGQVEVEEVSEEQRVAAARAQWEEGRVQAGSVQRRREGRLMPMRRPARRTAWRYSRAGPGGRHQLLVRHGALTAQEMIEHEGDTDEEDFIVPRRFVGAMIGAGASEEVADATYQAFFAFDE
uniref:Uncharacterized protein n=1 Tax=Thielaviopsis musarum TaxID=1580842 RepID=A0A2R4ZT61_9PEZI|nr:TPA_exp: hypothetical protein [Thielaviopsis musarum]